MSTTILLFGRDYPVSPPSGPSAFCAAEEWMLHAHTEALGFRVVGAALGLTTSLGKEAGCSMERSDYKILEYGAAVWGALRQRGATVAELSATAAACFPAVASLVTPKETEVRQAQDFTSGGGISTS